MDNEQRFEWLSAYLDQELSPEEAKKVEQWLKQDDQARQTYQNLLQLRYRLREIPIPPSRLSPDELTHAATTKAQRQKLKQYFLWTGGAVTALCLAIVTGALSTDKVSFPRWAGSNERQMASQSLMIALDQPVMEIPEDASSSEEASSTSPTSR